MSLGAFTLLHVVISLVGIVSGLVVAAGWLSGRRREGLTTVFLVSTVATSVSGFGFPFEKLLPSHIVGMLSLAALAVAIAARHLFALAGAWGKVFVVSSAIALYFNCFVLVVQSFLKVSVLRELAPTQTEPAFVVAQLGVLAGMVVVGFRATRRFGGVPLERSQGVN